MKLYHKKCKLHKNSFLIYSAHDSFSQINIKTMLIPTVIEKSQFGERAYDIYSRLLRENIIFLGGVIDDDTANIVIAQLLFLQSEDSKKDISLYINSPGGSASATLAMIDTINHIKNDVSTICIGMAASGGRAGALAGGRNNREAPAAIRPQLGGESVYHVMSLFVGHGAFPACDDQCLFRAISTLSHYKYNCTIVRARIRLDRRTYWVV